MPTVNKKRHEKREKAVQYKHFIHVKTICLCSRFHSVGSCFTNQVVWISFTFVLSRVDHGGQWTLQWNRLENWTPTKSMIDYVRAVSGVMRRPNYANSHEHAIQWMDLHLSANINGKLITFYTLAKLILEAITETAHVDKAIEQWISRFKSRWKWNVIYVNCEFA